MPISFSMSRKFNAQENNTIWSDTPWPIHTGVWMKRQPVSFYGTSSLQLKVRHIPVCSLHGLVLQRSCSGKPTSHYTRRPQRACGDTARHFPEQAQLCIVKEARQTLVRLDKRQANRDGKSDMAYILTTLREATYQYSFTWISLFQLFDHLMDPSHRHHVASFVISAFLRPNTTTTFLSACYRFVHLLHQTCSTPTGPMGRSAMSNQDVIVLPPLQVTGWCGAVGNFHSTLGNACLVRCLRKLHPARPEIDHRPSSSCESASLPPSAPCNCHWSYRKAMEGSPKRGRECRSHRSKVRINRRIVPTSTSVA